MLFVLLAAVLAVTAVSVAERVEQNVLVAPSAPDAPLTSAVLPSGTLALTLRDGAATITTGVDSPTIELATTTIGDLDLSELVDDAVIAQSDSEVSFDWGGITEWYRTVPEGIEHGYTIDAPVSATDDLTVTVAVTDGTPTLVGPDNVSISRPGATPLTYRGLIAFDADGTDLPAEMAVVDGTIELRVDTTGAVYPVTIDPIISDAEVIRIAPITQVVDTVRVGNLFGGADAVSPCPAGTLLTGLTVFQTPDGINWIRAAAPRCSEVLFTGPTVSLGTDVVVGPDFGDRTGSISPEQTADCPVGSAVTGFTGKVGDLVDNIALQCSPLLSDGSVGTPLVQLPAIGGEGGSTIDPVTCTDAFANGLQGRTGQDVDAIGLQCATVTPAADPTGERLGYAVDVDGNRMVASAPFAEVGGVAGAGKVYVYERSSEAGPWGLAATIPSPDPEADGGFGDAVSLFGDVVAVGESDRLDGSDEPGRVFVFERDGGGNWVPLGAPITSGQGGFDGFGASLDFLLDDVLVIGSPGFDGSRGAVFRANWNGSAWSVLTIDEGDSPGEEFGYSVAVDLWLAVGAPGVEGFSPPGPPAVGPDGGGLRIFEFTGNGPSGFEFRRGFSGYLTGSRVGTAVDVFGDRVVVGGYGDGINTTLRFDLFEYVDPDPGDLLPGDWNADVVRSFETGFDVGDGFVNDYLDIEGGVVAIGAPGLGGQVALFQFDGFNWSNSPVDVVQPSGREAGDRIGRALALDGRTLITGAPGDDGVGNVTADAGAVYSVRVPVVASALPNPPEGGGPSTVWDVGVVPGPDDHAIIPSNVNDFNPFTVSDSTTFGRLTVFGTLIVESELEVLGATRVNEGAVVLADGGRVTVPDAGLLIIENFGLVSVEADSDFLVRGDIQFDKGDLQIFGRLVIDGDVSIAGAELGSNQVANFGEVLKTGPGPLVVDSDVTWYSDGPALGEDLEIVGPPDRFVVEEGSVQIDGSSIVTPDGDGTRNAFPGFLRVGAGAAFEVTGDLVLESTTEIEIGIVGPSEPESDFFGRIIVTGNLTQAGLLRSDVVDYSPAPADAYPIITCGDCGPGAFTTLQVAPFDVVTTETAVTLQTTSVPPVTFVGDGSWSVPGNWSTGAVPGPTDDVVIPSGSTVVIDAGDSFGVDELTVEGEVRVEGSLTINGNSRIDAALLTVEEGGTLFIDGLLAIEEDSELRVSGGIEFDGGVLSIAPPAIDVAGAGRLTVDGEVSVAGTGQISNLGNVVKTGAGTLGVSSQVTWHSEPSSVLDVQEGSVLLAGGPIETVDGVAGFPGALRLAAGTTFDVQNDLILEDTSVVETEITGPSSNVANYGRVVVAGSLTKAGLLVSELVGYLPLSSDAYDVFECGNDCSLGDFDALDVDPFAVVTTQTAVTLQLPPSPPTVPTFTGGSGSWTNAANWSTGVVPEPTDDVVIPSGSTVVVEAGDIAEVGSLTAEGEVRVAGRLTINEDSAVTGLFDVLSGATLALDATLTVDGPGQLVVREGTGTPGVIEAGEGARFAGTGLVANSGTVRFSSTDVIPIDPDLTWNSGLNSLIEVLSGTLDIESLSFDTQGRFFIAPGAVLRIQNDFALVATSELAFGIDGPSSEIANYGRVELPSGTFTADGTVVLTPTDGFVPAGDVYPLIECTNGSCLAGDFDVVRGGVVDSRTENAIAFAFVAVNTYTGPATAIAPGDWSDPDGWSSGAVPGIGEPAAIPAGKVVELPAGAYAVGALSLAGTLTTRSAGTDIVFLLGDGSVIEPTGQLSFGGTFSCTDTSDPGCVSTNTLSIESDVRVDGLLGVTSSVFLDGLTGESLTSTPTVDVSDPLSLTGVGDVILSAPLVKTGTGTFSIGPDLSFDLAADAVLDVREGLVEIQGPGFVPNGTIQVAPGATVSVTGDLALRPTSTLNFGIDGPSESTDNFGRLELGGELTAAGTLRAAIDDGYTPTPSDRYPVISCEFCTGTFELTATAPLAVVVRATSIALDAPAAPEPDEPTFGSFAFDASTSSVSVASSGVATSAIPSRTVSGSTGQSGSVASTSLVGLDLNTPVGSNVAASPIASLTIGESVLSAVDVPSALDTLPLTDIDITVPIEGSDPIRFGGWEEILRQIDSEVLQSRPPQNIRFGEIKNFAPVRALRLDQITLAGTPIASLPIASLVLGSTPIASLGTDIDWCDEIAATGSAANCTNSIDPTDTTLVELTLAGIPIASLPIASLPIASLPIASLPIASLPIASLDLASTPIASLPIASLGPAGTPIASLPIASLPIASLEVAGIPIASLPIASLPIASLPIASLPIASLPIASLPVAGTPIASLSPDGSLVSIPIASLDVTGTPIASLPIASLPIASLPIASLPIASLPIASLPIASLPIASLDVRGTPIASLTVDGTLATLPIASLPIASLPIASLPIASLPIASLPIASLPIASFADRVVADRVVADREFARRDRDTDRIAQHRRHDRVVADRESPDCQPADRVVADRQSSDRLARRCRRLRPDRLRQHEPVPCRSTRHRAEARRHLRDVRSADRRAAVERGVAGSRALRSRVRRDPR
jgi:hypothetical protein